MLLPGCTTCCNCGCVCGTLPYAVTVTFTGLENKTHTQHCALTFSSCFGTGAAAVAISPGGYDSEDRGPLTGVLLIDGGCGYAVLGRIQPSLAISGSGNGATFTPTLTQDTDACGCKFWKLTSVAVSGGTGYTGLEQLTISVNGTVVIKPVATLVTGNGEPAVTAAVAGGSDAVLSVTVTSNGGTPETWGVSAVTVVSGGSNYAQGASVAFSTPHTEQLAAVATVTVTESAPSVPLTFETTTGTGASLTLNWTQSGNQWCASSVTINNAGTGYTVGDSFYWQDFDLSLAVRADVSSVNGSGGITALVIDGGSDCFPGSGGPIASVTITQAGEYFAPGSQPLSVNVTEQGIIYKEDPTEPPCVSDVTVTPCGGGSNAEISATVDDDPTSATFGQITGLTIDEAGDGYLAWEWTCLNHSELNGEPLVLPAVNPKKLVTVLVESCFGSGACVEIDAVGAQQTCGEETVTADYDGQPGPIRQITLANAGSGYAVLGREQPSLTFGGNATFTPTLLEQSDACGRPYWTINSLTVSGGTGYTNGQQVQITGATGNDKVGVVADIVLTTVRQAPTLSAAAGGTATFAVAVEQFSQTPPLWRVSAVSVLDGGGGYSRRTRLTFSAGILDQQEYVAVAVAKAGENGVIESVDVLSGGVYWHDSGVPDAVTVSNGGQFYRENTALPALVATPAATIVQLPPSNGSGASITLSVNSTVGSDNFGKLTATLANGGSNYTLLGGPLDCQYAKTVCDLGLDGDLVVTMALRGAGQKPEVILQDTRSYPQVYAVWRADEALADCSNLPDTYPLLYGVSAGSAAVTAGGTVATPCDQPAWCAVCLCPDFDEYCSTIEYEDGIGADTVSGTGYFFNTTNGGVGRLAASIVCDEGTGIVTLSATLAFLNAVPPCPTTVSFFKRIDFRCDEACSIIGEYTLDLADPALCAGCDCGSITWTIAEAPC